MDIKPIIKKIYRKIFIFGIISFSLFLILTLSLYFFSKLLIQQLTEIKDLKQELSQKRYGLEKETFSRKIASYIQEKTGQDLSALLYNVSSKLDRNLDGIKELIDEKLNSEKVKIIKTEINQDELTYNFEIPFDRFDSFSKFLVEELIILRIKNWQIEKQENNYLINLTIQ